ncbi:IS110 family transposase, partial [Bradyrhizobium liaoningense]|nr:IS110 family transposase [Bradyrhizobium liaoningense]MBR1005006.1 IS110 family transposase [Bradyrhizobium liaoningense]MBR1034599.1 IS110 family transposase [Bradyrhizobium liaoningense]MBR1071249.1 IS110 family transposase [Bradyrhizobium liaoningense]
MNGSIFVGLDVHKATISVAVAEAMRGGEVRNLGIIPNRADQIDKLAKKLGKGDRQVSFCYEAGPCAGVSEHIRRCSDRGVESDSLVPRA